MSTCVDRDVDRADGGAVGRHRPSARSGSVALRWQAGRVALSISSPLPADRAEPLVEVRRSARRRGPRASDAALARRARELTAEHLPADVWPVSIRWVSTMGVRWASCTPSDRTIRVSDRLRDAPGWVLDYVIVHELAHVLVAGHDADFWALVERYPRSERARGYLEGVTAAERQPTELVPEATEGDDEQPSDTLF